MATGCAAFALFLAGVASSEPVSQVGAAVDATQSLFEVYPVPYADPKTIEEFARKIVGNEGTVMYDEHNLRLLVAAPRHKHQELKGILDKVNVIPRNVRIEVEFKERTDASRSEVSVSAEGEITAEEGLDSTTIRIKPKILSEAVQGSSSVKQTLLVASGREGTLNIGQSVPYLEWLMGYGVAAGNVKWQSVGARLVVEPLVIGQGPMVRVRITPELSGMVDGRPYHARFSGASTEVTVQDGQSFSIGGLTRDEAFYNRFLIGRSQAGRDEAVDIVLTPRIMGAQGP